MLVGQNIETAQIDVKTGVTLTSNAINDALKQAVQDFKNNRKGVVKLKTEQLSFHASENRHIKEKTARFKVHRRRLREVQTEKSVEKRIKT